MNRSLRRGAAAGIGVQAWVVLFVAVAALGGEEVRELSREDAGRLENPLPYTKELVREGRKHYLRLCQNCHGKDGRALDNFDFEATDLTAPERYVHGSSAGDVFYTIASGAGIDMPGFGDKLSDEQVWQVVSFIRSIDPKAERPTAEAGDS